MPPSPSPNPPPHPATEVLIIGGGAAGIGVAASLRRRRPQLDIAIIEPSDAHYYQPAWTLVGGGAFDAGRTVRQTDTLIPARVRRIRASATHIDTATHRVTLDDGRSVRYSQVIVSPGLRLAWERIEGLEAALGQHGVTSNYRFDLAPYTWSLVRGLRSGRALFTQPAMPIKCAGAPQKAMYLACDHWRRTGVNLNSSPPPRATIAPAIHRPIVRRHAPLHPPAAGQHRRPRRGAAAQDVRPGRLRPGGGRRSPAQHPEQLRPHGPTAAHDAVHQPGPAEKPQALGKAS